MKKREYPYRTILAMAIIHFCLMFALMYLMVNKFSDIFLNLNQFYMAAIMTIPMIILELFFMKMMYPSKKYNIIIISLAFLAFILLFLFIRSQSGISDGQFLKSMIPHHSSAILMCEKASIKDAQIRELCQSIISSQQSEIDFMKEKLKEIG